MTGHKRGDMHGHRRLAEFGKQRERSDAFVPPKVNGNRALEAAEDIITRAERGGLITQRQIKWAHDVIAAAREGRMPMRSDTP